MRLDQLDPVAKRILHVPAITAFDRLVLILDLEAGSAGFFDNVVKAVDDERRVCLARRNEILVNAEMNRQSAIPEPATAACGELRWLGNFGESQDIPIKSPRLALSPGRHRDQDVVDCANGHLPPCMCPAGTITRASWSVPVPGRPGVTDSSSYFPPTVKLGGHPP